MTAVYLWRPRAKFNIDATVAGEELSRIKGHNSGDLTPEMVLKAAENKSNPLHSVFEWDDAKAAQQQRLYIAGQLIKSIVVTITGPEATAPTSVNVNITSAAATQASSAQVVSEAELHQKKVTRGWDALENWSKTYGALPEFAQINAVLQALLPKTSKAA
jgi:hypothetical protein